MFSAFVTPIKMLMKQSKTRVSLTPREARRILSAIPEAVCICKHFKHSDIPNQPDRSVVMTAWNLFLRNVYRIIGISTQTTLLAVCMEIIPVWLVRTKRILVDGRLSPGVSRAFDLPFIGFTAEGEPDNGRLPTDRPHVFNIYGAYIFNWMGSKTNSTEFSAFQTVTSGTPQTTSIYGQSSCNSANILSSRRSWAHVRSFLRRILV